MTPLRSLDRGDDRLDPDDPRRPGADPQPPAARALRALWLATGVVLLVLSAWREALDTIAGWVGVTEYPPAVLFAVGILFILLVLLHYSTVISKLADQNVILAQRLALLETRLTAEPQARWRGSRKAASCSGADDGPARQEPGPALGVVPGAQ